MTRRTYLVLGILAALGFASLLYLRSYRLELVQNIVVHALLQKAGGGHAEEVERVFELSLASARASGRDAEYLADLIRLSQKLEKLQSMERAELLRILASFEERWAMGAASKKAN